MLIISVFCWKISYQKEQIISTLLRLRLSASAYAYALVTTSHKPFVVVPTPLPCLLKTQQLKQRRLKTPLQLYLT